MPGIFPGDQSLQILTQAPHGQGAKRKRSSHLSDNESAAVERPILPKKLRTRPPASGTSQPTEDEHRPAPVLSVRAPEASKTPNEPLRDYQRIRKLGESTEGKVYLVKSKKTTELLAIKILRKAQGQIDAASALHLNLPMHPHIIFMSQIDIVDHHVWQGIEYANGGDLLTFLERLEDFTLSEIGRRAFVVHILVQLGEAIAFLHYGLRRVCKGQWEADAGWQGIIWGDIKPPNVLLNFSHANEYGLLPDIRLADSGHATLASSPWVVTGSPLFFCPEADAADRGLKGPPVSLKSDVYTMALTLYLFITMKHWPTGKDPRFMRLPAEYHDLGFTHLLTQCLQVDPRRRPSMNCHLGSGLVPALDQAWDVRDNLMRQCKSSDTDFWVKWRKEAWR